MIFDCGGCGVKTHRPGTRKQSVRFCSRACQRTAGKTFACKGCGKVGLARSRSAMKFCSALCHSVASRKRVPSACGHTMIPASRAGAVCSVCAHTCKACGGPKGANGLTCSAACYEALRGRRSNDNDKSRLAAETIGITCAHCRAKVKGQSVTRQFRRGVVRPLAYCSRLCQSRFNSRIGFSRRAQWRAASPIEIFDRREIFDRDGWHCRRCGSECLASYYGAPIPKDREAMWHYPTLDHIVPLSRGGTHTKANVQLLCFRCNARKSNKYPEPALGGSR